ncbi:hypothetical protein PFICI_01282 [Pestalotiopsis fici W106-1]|uniref:Non-reducing end beta-L-arabinofuranosidase-like GH127 catalytic domain-containing protein n=1 Tax=Pestalotiopsis fici (strain W106-1 / CGMCC3.15140) TaxID=1229662 RepID=W3XN85_PESFW|nr:uncharacterized protein PFICI_01282 [Pestalotiopsis fici W106-1]ETS87454.1 hypothetical protein PFICI_01282 [Pestalotiopsis fici W106-1]
MKALLGFISTLVYDIAAQGTNSSTGSMTLVPFKLDSFPLGSIRASGWLHDQLRLSADGLSGHLFDFYRYVAQSEWLGGTFEYSELHESAPYWFNAIVPLAWGLNDTRLQDQARQFLDYTLEHQAKDGWLGPETTRQTRGIWARSLLFFGLIQYAEADVSQQDRIVTAMHKFVTLTHSMLQNNFTGLIQQKSLEDDFDPFGYGLSRTHELPISLMWLYEHHPGNQSAIILETIDLMFQGGRVVGRDWTTFFVNGVFPRNTTYKASGFTHGVNIAEGLRYPSVLYRYTKNESLVQQTLDAVAMVVKYHTALSGTLIADEHLGGLSPQRGSELCMAVESMFSYAWLYRLHAVSDFADRAERAAFNALPAAVSPDWWSHQYVTQTNQPWSRNLTSANPFFDVVSYGNTFGLEPNFPCCTVNHGQGYPKYVSSSYGRLGSTGVAHILLGPTSLKTTLGGSSAVQVDCHTNYPFSSSLEYTVTSEVAFDFYVRIPEWTAMNSSFAMQNGHKSPLKPEADGLHHFRLEQGATKLSVFLDMSINIVMRNGSAGVYRGPLLYAAAADYNETAFQPLNWTDRSALPTAQVDPRSRDHALIPTSPWMYAIDPSTVAMESGGDLRGPLSNPIFSKHAILPTLAVDAYRFDWPIDHDTAAIPPIKPTVDVSSRTRLKLIPYGAAKLHIAQFPVVDLAANTLIS